MNTAALGAGADLGADTSHKAKALLGPAAFLVTGEEPPRCLRGWGLALWGLRKRGGRGAGL
jgi:hypothetical protein